MSYCGNCGDPLTSTYALAPGGTIWEIRRGKLIRTWIEATCPICSKRSLRLRKWTVDTKVVTGTNSKGEPVDRERAVVEPRLVCKNNPEDHVFKLDPALVTDK